MRNCLLSEKGTNLLTRYLSVAFVLILSIFIIINASAQSGRGVNFDENWRFFRGGVERGEYVDFDDSKWRVVDLPHDWSIEDLPGKDNPFDPDAISQVSGGFTTGGTGWYRKSFTIPATEKGKRILILFDGVYMNSDVWLNGQPIGNHPYGYTSFYYDLTDKIKFGEKNILAVQVKNEGQNSRWYSGSGINRHVWLQVLQPIHISEWGVYINTTDISATSATVKINTQIDRAGDYRSAATVVTTIYDPKGKKVGLASTEIGGALNEVAAQIKILAPELWLIEKPSLYVAKTQVYTDGRLMDEVENHFGIRTITIDAEHGLLLNGKPVKLKGGCYHNDNGPLGSRAYDRAEERRVELMKASGFNAIRCSHNPPAPAFLDACDRLGILVVDEAFDTWSEPKNPYDYSLYFNQWWQRDVGNMVERDRNHASIIMWSIGNEIPNRHKPEVATTAKTLADYIKKLDPTRPVTSAVNDVKPDKDPYFSALDVAGYNYAVNKYEEDHLRKPQRVMMATESYALEAFDYWMAVLDHPYVIGDFIWTGFDYIGESSIGWRGYYQEKNFYPWNLAYCGDIDICGWKRPQSYYRDALWKPDQVSIFVTPPTPSFELNPRIETWSKWNWYDVVADWNWASYENKPFKVTVYSSCDEVELFLNNHSLGKKITNRSTQFLAHWDVPFQVGTLKAIGYKNRKQVNQAQLVTASQVSKIEMHADRTELKANGEDLSYISVSLCDQNGVRHPKAENFVKFEIEGPGIIVGVGNANPVSLESYQLPQRKAWQGRCMLVVKSTGKPGAIHVKATSTGINSSELTLTSN